MNQCCRIAAIAFLVLELVSPRAAMAEITVAPRDMTIETVFSWSRDRCDDLDIPDSPARALRLPDHDVLLTASHYTNVPLVGSDLNTVKPLCGAAARGRELDDPRQFDDRVWIQALSYLANGRIFALGSEEYLGSRHAGRCTTVKQQCWYSSITKLTADPKDLLFSDLDLERRVLARPPLPFNGDAVTRVGFFSASNIVSDGTYEYVLVYAEGIPGQGRGNCLLRARKGDLVDGWRTLVSDSFTGVLNIEPSKTRAPDQPSCDLIGRESLGVVRSVVRDVKSRTWLAFFAVKDGKDEGVYYSTSPDLISWTRRRLLVNLSMFVGQKEAGIYYQYPSVIDPTSSSVTFDSVSGEPYLYLTRFNLYPDRRRGMDRDLVRLRLAISE